MAAPINAGRPSLLALSSSPPITENLYFAPGFLLGPGHTGQGPSSFTDAHFYSLPVMQPCSVLGSHPPTPPTPSGTHPSPDPPHDASSTTVLHIPHPRAGSTWGAWPWPPETKAEVKRQWRYLFHIILELIQASYSKSKVWWAISSPLSTGPKAGPPDSGHRPVCAEECGTMTGPQASDLDSVSKSHLEQITHPL